MMFDMRDRNVILEAMDGIVTIDGLKERIVQMHALHGEQTDAWAHGPTYIEKFGCPVDAEKRAPGLSW
jgi:hypothetical protein